MVARKGGGIMAVLSFHCQNYKAGALHGIDGHNRRLHKNHISNPDIDNSRSCNNRIYKAPDISLHADCKKLIQKKVLANGNKVRKDSNWICECIFTYPAELPLERLDEYNALIIKYISARLGASNLVEAVCHMDEAGQPHLHLDYVLITEDCRLSSKDLITRDFIRSVHDKLPLVLQHHGFYVVRGESVPDRKANRSATQYKKDMEKEAKALDKKLNNMVDEYNQLAEHYNHLLSEAKALEQRNIKKAKELLEERERTR